MNNISLLSDTLYAQEGVVARKKSFIVSALILIVGCAVAVWSLKSPALAENKSLTSALMLIGSLVALFGLIRLLVGISARVPYYSPTGEKLRCQKIYFDMSEQMCIRDSVIPFDLGNIFDQGFTDFGGRIFGLFATEF